MKRRLIALAAVILTLAVGLSVIACDNTDTVTYNVTANFDAQKGTVTITDDTGAAATEFAAGSTATVTVTALGGYTVSSVTVGGAAVQLTDGVYTFTVNADTVISAEFINTSSNPNVYTVTANYDAQKGTVTVTNGTNAATEFAAGSTATVTITALSGYTVSSVTVGGTAVQLTDGVYTFTVNADTVINAEFTSTSSVYTVTANYDAQKGTVTVTNGTNAATEFAAGSTATVTITALSGYTVSRVTVGGTAVQLTDGVYTFTVNADTVITAEFEVSPEVLFAQAYASVSSTFKAVGEYEYAIEGQVPVNNKITTIFANNVIYNLETNAAGTEVYNEAVYVNRDGKIAAPVRNADNEITFVKSDPEEDYAEYDNPFKTLTVADFAATNRSNVFALRDLNKARTAATAITGWRETITNFYLTFANGKITKIEIRTARILVAGTDDTYYTSSYIFVLSDWGAATVDPELTSPYTKTADHIALENALTAARVSDNYTLSIYEKEEGIEDLAYDVYVTNQAVYNDCVGWEDGYVQKDGKVYPFDYDPDTEKVTLRDPVSGFATIREMRATFADFAVELFEYKGNGVYVLRDNYLAGEVLVNFADDIDKMLLYYRYTLNAKITLRDGVLYSMETDYYVYGAYVNRVVTYSDFNTTVMPISFDNIEETSVLDEYVGTYTDGTYTAVIDVQTGIKINDTAFEVTSYSVLDDIFTGRWNGGTWYLYKLSQNQIVITDRTNYYTLNKTDVGNVQIPESYGGVWKNLQHTAVIADGGVSLDGVTLDLLSYTEREGLVAVKEGVTYNFVLTESTMYVNIFVEAEISGQYELAKDPSAVIIPSLFIGTFTGFDGSSFTDYKAVITQTAVTVTVGVTEKQTTVLRVEEVEPWGTSLKALYVSMDGKEYMFEESSEAGRITLYSAFDDGRSLRVSLEKQSGGDDPQPSVTIPDKFHGSFEGSGNNVDYAIEISADGITVAIGSAAPVQAEIVEIDSDVFTLSIGNVTYYLMQHGYDDDVDRIDFATEDFTTVYVTLDRVQPSTEIPSLFIGTFTGTDSYANVDYKAEISQSSIKVTMGTAEKTAEVKSVVQEDSYGGKVWSLYVLIDGKEYVFSEGYSDTQILFGSVFDDYASVSVTLNKQSGGDEPGPAPTVAIPEKFRGSYMLRSDNTTYFITIDEDGIYVSLGGAEITAVITEYSEYEGFTITLDGDTYYLQDAGSGEPINSIRLLSEDFVTLNIVLTRI